MVVPSLINQHDPNTIKLQITRRCIAITRHCTAVSPHYITPRYQPTITLSFTASQYTTTVLQNHRIASHLHITIVTYPFYIAPSHRRHTTDRQPFLRNIITTRYHHIALYRITINHHCIVITTPHCTYISPPLRISSLIPMVMPSFSN